MNILTNEEMEALTRKVWEAKRTEIEKSIEAGIADQFRANAYSMAGKIVISEMREIIAPILEASREKLKAQAQETVDKLTARMEKEVTNQVVDMFREFSTALGTKHGMNSAITSMFRWNSETHSYDLVKEKP